MLERQHLQASYDMFDLEARWMGCWTNSICKQVMKHLTLKHVEWDVEQISFASKLLIVLPWHASKKGYLCNPPWGRPPLRVWDQRCHEDGSIMSRRFQRKQSPPASSWTRRWSAIGTLWIYRKYEQHLSETEPKGASWAEHVRGFKATFPFPSFFQVVFFPGRPHIDFWAWTHLRRPRLSRM